jgi:hypothetical protein
VYDGIREVGKHDVEALYQAIKEFHNEAASDTLQFIQHASLVPRLRPYQSQAVKWMLCRESVTDHTSDGKYFQVIFFIDNESAQNISRFLYLMKTRIFVLLKYKSVMLHQRAIATVYHDGTMTIYIFKGGVYTSLKLLLRFS